MTMQRSKASYALGAGVCELGGCELPNVGYWKPNSGPSARAVKTF